MRVCRSKGIQKRPPKKTYYVEEDLPEDQGTSEDSAYTMFALRNQGSDPILREVHINRVPVKMELDTGAAVSVITQNTYQKIAQQGNIQPLQHSDLKLKSYSGETMQSFSARFEYVYFVVRRNDIIGQLLIRLGK